MVRKNSIRFYSSTHHSSSHFFVGCFWSRWRRWSCQRLTLKTPRGSRHSFSRSTQAFFWGRTNYYRTSRVPVSIKPYYLTPSAYVCSIFSEWHQCLLSVYRNFYVRPSNCSTLWGLLLWPDFQSFWTPILWWRNLLATPLSIPIPASTDRITGWRRVSRRVKWPCRSIYCVPCSPFFLLLEPST